MAKLTAHERAAILRKAADLIAARQEDFGRTISMEEGKILAEGRLEAARAVDTLNELGGGGRALHGETVPARRGAPRARASSGVTLRVPCGIVVAITPFNFPLNLVCAQGGAGPRGRQRGHREARQRHTAVGPQADRDAARGRAAARGDQHADRPGGEVGDLLVQDRRVRKITFTGSRDVGEHICRMAGIKRVTMELGSNAPVIVMPDADLDKVAAAIAATGYANAGQVCISAQRVLAAERRLRRLARRAQAARRGADTRQPARRDR